VAQCVAYEPKFKLTVDINELLNRIMVPAQWQHLVNKELEAEIASSLIKVGFYLKLAFRITTNVSPLYAGHRCQKIFQQERLLDVDWETPQRFGFLLLFLWHNFCKSRVLLRDTVVI